MARSLLGFILGVVLVFPGAEVLRWLVSQVFGIYTDMTLTDACLAMIIIMQAILLARGTRGSAPPRYPPVMKMVGHRAELRPVSVPAPVRRRPRPRSRDAQAAPPRMRVHMPEDDLDKLRSRTSRRPPRR